MGREHITGASGRRRPGAIGGAQAALAVLVVGGTALGALLLHPDTNLFADGRGPLGGNAGLVIVLALLTFFGGLAVRGRYLKLVGADRQLTPVEQRLVDGVGGVLLGAPLVVPVLMLVLYRSGSSGGDQGDDRRPVRLPTGPPTPTPGPTAPQRPALPRNKEHFLDAEMLRILVTAGVVVAAVVAGVYLWRHLTRPPAPVSRATYAMLDDEQERLARAVDSGRRALLEGTDARAAVIACYVAMEESLAGSGTARRASDSPQDLLERAVAGGVPARAAAAELTALFREARYSTHPMDGGHRDRAAAAAAEITDALRARERGPDAVAGTT